MEQKQENLHATNHYLYYPDEKNIPQYLAYGFRPVFLLLAPYMILSMILWGLVWSGIINIPFMNDTLTWHIYEMLFGILAAGVMAFLTTVLKFIIFMVSSYLDDTIYAVYKSIF